MASSETNGKLLAGSVKPAVILNRLLFLQIRVVNIVRNRKILSCHELKLLGHTYRDKGCNHTPIILSL
jgi:hypothetical protein